MGEWPVKINDLIQVTVIGEGPGTTYPTRVDDIINEKLVLAWPTNLGVLIPIRIGQPLELYFIREDAVYSFASKVDESQREPVPRIALREAGPVRRIQRRAYFRVRAMIPVQLTGTVRTDASGNDHHTSVLHIVSSTVDISGAGIAIHHGSPIPVDTMFEAKLSIDPDEPPMKLLTRVVHSEQVVGLEEDRRVYRVAFFFIAITEAQRRKIVRRCFRIQQESLAH